MKIPLGWGDVPEPLSRQLSFLLEVDRLKSVMRSNRIADDSRCENTAEHSWHLTLFALALQEHAIPEVNIARVVEMLIVHDIVEIECGDLPLFGGGDAAAQQLAERAAAERIFDLLPASQSDRFKTLWSEFEDRITPDARFAKALDRFQPILLNALTQGGTWRDYDVDVDAVRQTTRYIADGAPGLWTVAEGIFDDAVEKGWLRGSRQEER